MEAYWITTQRLLQQGSEPIVRRPKLTEALLKRPPFRFLHDIVSEVTRRTGFADGLFAGEELVSSELKDKDAKLRYLSKIINCVGLTLNAHVPVRPAKILAGLEPEQTNIFIQMLGQAALVDSKKSSKAVYLCLAGESMPSAEQMTSIIDSGQISHESASNQSVSAEKLKRSMYSPIPDIIELPRSKPPECSHNVNVTFSAGGDDEHEKSFPENIGTCTTADDAPTQEEDPGSSQSAGQNEPEVCLEPEWASKASTTGNLSETDNKREELQRLREGIQALCQAISPLGKYIDYLQEDAEAMAKEYQFWIKEQQMYSTELERERQSTDLAVQAESLKILELDEEIKSQQQLNNIVKAEILQNDEAIMAVLQAASTPRNVTKIP